MKSKKRTLLDLFLRRAVLKGTDHRADPRTVRAMIPHAWFTKKGPGVENGTRLAFFDMTMAQKELAVQRGWIPEGWLVEYLTKINIEKAVKAGKVSAKWI